MPSLGDIASVLEEHRGRFEALDAFVDDVEELRAHGLDARVLEHPNRFLVQTGRRKIDVQVFPDQGVARFRLAGPAAATTSGAADGAALRAVVGTAIGAAQNTKEGLLGGLLLGMLVGGALGAAKGSSEPERVLALQFEPTSSQWHLYDGPLLRCAKRTLQPPQTAPKR